MAYSIIIPQNELILKSVVVLERSNATFILRKIKISNLSLIPSL